MKTKPKGSMTLAEHDAQLKAEGKWDAYIAMMAEKERLCLEKVARLAVIEASLMKDLSDAGVPTKNGVWDIISDRKQCVKALPVLAQHLERDYPYEIQSGIARAMAWPEALDWRPDFIRLFKQQPFFNTHFRQGLVLGIRNTTGPHNVRETIDIMRDHSLGEERVLIVSLFARVKEEDVRQAILELRDVPVLAKEIAKLGWVKKLDKAMKSVFK